MARVLQTQRIIDVRCRKGRLCFGAKIMPVFEKHVARDPKCRSVVWYQNDHPLLQRRPPPNINNCVRQRPIALVQASDREYIGAKIGAVWVSRMNDIVTADYIPSEDEPFMNERQKSYFRQKLVTWKNDILREARETLEILQQENANHPDLADRASSETDRAIELRARDRQRKLISKIDSALQRIDEGTYGYCEETGEPIALKRLDARPIATLSIEAQERHERREKVYRDD